jgi:hypothetical protein
MKEIVICQVAEVPDIGFYPLDNITLLPDLIDVAFSNDQGDRDGDNHQREQQHAEIELRSDSHGPSLPLMMLTASGFTFFRPDVWM